MRWILPLLLCAQAVSAQPASLPDQFGSGSNAFTIDFVVVGDVGNAPHSSGVGSVGYHYRIGKYEISENFITKAEAQGMTSVPREFGFGDQPIDISWADAAKFVNFLNTSKGYPAAYNVVEGQLPTRNPNAYYYIPSDNEWVKAAHYKGGGTNAGYWRYAIGSDTTPQPTNSSVLPNTVVYWGQSSQSYPSTSVYTAGGLSPYGTMGQNGNFSEYTDTLFAINQRRTRGGAFSSTINSGSDGLHLTNVSITSSLYDWFWNIGRKGASTGFRVASVHDTNKPVLTLNGSNMIVFRGLPFVDPSVTFTDNYDPPRPINTNGSVNTMVVGTYTLTYSAKDNAGNEATPVTRTVEVVLDPNGDEDNDGLNNTEEANLGTNPYLRDTDGDGVNDLREVGDSTDPLDPASFDSLNLGLVAYYLFNGNAKDESGYGLHRFGSMVFGANRFGIAQEAVKAASTSGGAVPPPNSPASRTVSFWLKIAAYSPVYFSWPDSPLAGNRGAVQFQGGLGNAGLGFSDNGYLWMDSGNGVAHFLVGLFEQWKQVTVVYEGSIRLARVYVDGHPVVLTHWGMGPKEDIDLSNQTQFSMSAGDWSLDDLRVYNRALSSAEVAALYASEKYAGFGLEGAATKSPFDPATAANWNAGGTPWTVDTSVTHDGVDSVKAQTTDGQSTYREYTVTGPAVADFWWKVSSEKNYDKFSYSLNGMNQETISGEVDWTYRTLTLPAGTHTIRWTYSKDESGAVGQDVGWLDDFAVYPATATLQVRDGATLLSGTATVDFGSADTGSTGFGKSLTFANEGYVPLEVQLSLPDGSPFTFEDGSAAYELLLGRDESLDVPIVLSTQAAGTQTAQLTISAPDSTIAPPAITLTGYVRGPDIGVAQGSSSLTSGQTFDMGLAPRTVEFTIRNNGNSGDLVISAISATGNFQITQQPAMTIPPQTSTTFKVLAQNVASGVQSGSVSIASNAGNLETFSLTLTSKSLISVEGIADGSMATSGTGGATAWDFAATTLPSGQSGQALKTGTTPNNGGSVLEFTTQTAGVVSWSWKVSTQEDFDWLLCEVDGQETAGISTKNGVWQTQVVQVPAGANVRWVYRKDGSGNIGEDAGYLANVEFRSLAANQSFSQWAEFHRWPIIPEKHLPKSGLQAMFAWLGGIDPAVGPDAGHHVPIVEGGLLKYRFPISKTADGTQQILYSPDMGAWTTRRFSQRIVSEDADRLVIEATAPSGTKGFFRLGAQPPPLIEVDTVPVGDAGNAADINGFGSVSYEYRIGKYEVTIAQYTAFLNSVAQSDPYGLYNVAMATNQNVAGIQRSGGGTPTDPYSYLPIGNSSRPIAYVSWFDAARFANWIHNGAAHGADTENGAYALSGKTNGSAVGKNSNAKWWIPTEDEWYKAAYYKGGGAFAGYWMYPTQSDSAPNNTLGGATNQANYYAADFAVTQSDFYSEMQNYLTDVGAFSGSASAFGTFDQGGNLYEWNDTSIGSSKGQRGGYWAGGGLEKSSDRFIDGGSATNESFAVGFRVARNAED
jgi:hypothetical protein